jgi:hypothetical protein
MRNSFRKSKSDFSGALWSSAERVVEENHKEKRINRISFQSVKKFSTIWQSYESPLQAPPHYYDEYLISMSINDSYKKYTNDSSVTDYKKVLDKI